MILPLNDKLILIEPYALKCSLKRIDFARNKSLLDDLGERVHNENFRKKFVEIIENHTRLGKLSAIKNLTMNIIQVESSRYMQEAVVDLHLETSDGKCVNIIDYIQKCLPDEETARFDDCDQVEDDQRSSEVTIHKSPDTVSNAIVCFFYFLFFHFFFVAKKISYFPFNF